MANLNELNPFTRFCMTIGHLPTSYTESLTYEEQLIWLCDFIKNKVIPAINNNSEALKEVQELYVELKSYVDNYFENLDVQTEINQKLDEMALDGTLENIINQEIFSELNDSLNQNIEKTNNNEFILTDTCKIIMPYRGQNASDCFIIEENGKTILIDLGSTIAPLITFLSNNNITKIDYIILSHYHADHVAGASAEGFITLLENENIDFSDLIVYLPHKGIDWSRIEDTNKSIMQTAESIIKDYLTSNNIEYIEPDNLETLVLSEICNLKFLNIGSSYYNSYYGNGGNVNEYNNFSMVVELNHNNRYVLFTGDIYVEAQENITPLIHEPDILKAPHHDLESISSEVFMKKLTSCIMIFAENQNYYGSGLVTPISQTIKNNGGKIYDTNVSHDVTILLKNDNIMQNSENGTFSLQSPNVLTASGIHIAKNTNLNDLKTHGNYFTLNNDETKSLENLPFEIENETAEQPSAFGRIKVINIGFDISNTIFKQFLISPKYIFYRIYNDDTWSKWVNISNDNILGLTDNFLPLETDLNNIFEIGKYEINDNTFYNSLQNAPSTNEGNAILLVLGGRLFTDIRRQILLTASGNIYIRNFTMDLYNTTPTSISDWKKVTLENIQ